MTFYCRAAASDHLSTRSLLCRVRDNSVFIETPHPRSGSIPNASQPFSAAVGSSLTSRFLEQLSDTIVVALWATLMLTAALPIPQVVHRTIGRRPTLRACGVFGPTLHKPRPTYLLMSTGLRKRQQALLITSQQTLV
jgi:hypothetical protein